MVNQFTTAGKRTVKITFEKSPARIEIFNNGRLYFFRDLNGQPEIKVNIAKAGKFYINIPVQSIEILPLKVYPINYPLPSIQKNFWRENIKYVFNPNLEGTPARCYFKRGIIEYGKNFLKQPFPIRVFILCHELGHFFYKDETAADVFGAQLFISQGYNNSTAYYALKNVLNLNAPLNRERVLNLFNHVKR